MSPLKRPVYALQLHFRVRFVLVAPGSLKILLRLLYTYAYEVKQIKIKYSTVHVHYMSRPCIMYCTWIMCTWTMYTHTVQYMYCTCTCTLHDLLYPYMHIHVHCVHVQNTYMYTMNMYCTCTLFFMPLFIIHVYRESSFSSNERLV